MFSYFFKHGIKNITSHKLMGLASVCIMAASLMLLGLFAVAGLNINSFMDKLGDSCEINVYIKADAGGRSIADIEGELGQISGVSKVKFYSREDRLDKVTNEVYGEGGYAFYNQNNPLRDSYILTISDLSQSNRISEQAKNVGGVDEVIQNQDIIGGIDTITRAIKNIGLWIMLIFLILSIFIISNTIKLGIASQGEEIGIMKIVGATNGFIRGPFLMQGFLLGIFGAIPASGLLVLGYSVVVRKVSNFIPPDIMTFVSVSDAAVILIPMFFGIGILVGIIGSYTATGKYLK